MIDKKKQKSDRIKETKKINRQLGEHKDTKKYDRNLIIELRSSGFSIRQIAKKIGSSTWPVWNTINNVPVKD